MNSMLYGTDGPEWDGWNLTEDEWDDIEREKEMLRDHLKDVQ